MADNSHADRIGEDSGIAELQTTLSSPNSTFTQRYDAARAYIDSLAKPVGSLGTLEDWAARISSLQKSARPSIASFLCLIFAADHGVAKSKSDGGSECSAYPQAVTRKVLEGLDHGVAGASVLANCNGVNLRVVDMGVADGPQKYDWSGDVVRESVHRVEGGTANFCVGDALTEEQVEDCISAGKVEVAKFIEEQGASANQTIVMFGEVGIGNTTTSAALIAALTGITDIPSLSGSGASTSRDGINPDIVSKKVGIVQQAMKRHGSLVGDPRKALQAVGGAEICAIVGGMLEASHRNTPILVDGFIVATAAMVACEMDPSVCCALLFATSSTEKGQAVALQTIQGIAKRLDLPSLAKPALNMELRMGEATGCLTAVPLAKSACAIMKMATLERVLTIDMSKGY
ncbi:hypothetical protein ACHAWF_012438 [Thalassiosira exigua]